MSTAIVTITGKVGTEPKVVNTTTRTGASLTIVEFRLADQVYDPKAAENRQKSSKETSEKYRTVWYNCKVLGVRGENWVKNNIIEKFAVVSVAGKLSDRFWETRDGEEVRELVVEVVECDRVLSADESQMVRDRRKDEYNRRSDHNQGDDQWSDQRRGQTQQSVPVNVPAQQQQPAPQTQQAQTGDSEEDIPW